MAAQDDRGDHTGASNSEHFVLYSDDVMNMPTSHHKLEYQLNMYNQLAVIEILSHSLRSTAF